MERVNSKLFGSSGGQPHQMQLRPNVLGWRTHRSDATRIHQFIKIHVVLIAEWVVVIVPVVISVMRRNHGNE
jgi:hypothetical protein